VLLIIAGHVLPPADRQSSWESFTNAALRDALFGDPFRDKVGKSLFPSLFLPHGGGLFVGRLSCVRDGLPADSPLQHSSSFDEVFYHCPLEALAAEDWDAPASRSFWPRHPEALAILHANGVGPYAAQRALAAVAGHHERCNSCGVLWEQRPRGRWQSEGPFEQCRRTPCDHLVCGRCWLDMELEQYRARAPLQCPECEASCEAPPDECGEAGAILWIVEHVTAKALEWLYARPGWPPTESNGDSWLEDELLPTPEAGACMTKRDVARSSIDVFRALSDSVDGPRLRLLVRKAKARG
jgi:hypothetical protein